jgi:hypothetical protein
VLICRLQPRPGLHSVTHFQKCRYIFSRDDWRAWLPADPGWPSY